MLAVSALPVLGAQASAHPTDFQSYGVSRISTSEDFSGLLRISIASDGPGPFFLVSLLIILSYPVEADLILDSVTLDSTTVPLSNIMPRLIVVPAKSYVGDVVPIMPKAGFTLVSEPMGNLALAGSGPDGVVIVLKAGYGSPAGLKVQCVALITAPTTETVTMAVN